MNKVRTKILGLLLCLTLMLGMIPVQASNETTALITREQAVVSIINAVGLDALSETQSDLSTFIDAAQVTAEYRDELAIAVTNSILAGTASKALNPRGNVTRLEFAMFLSRAVRELPALRASESFTDVPATAAGNVGRLVKAGLMSGYGNGLFGSDDYLTLEQLTAVLNRVNHLSSTRLQDDFYYAINHNWLTTTKLPAGYPMLSSFDEVNLSNSQKLKAMAKDLLKNSGSYEEGTKEQKMADFYSSILDMENRNAQGIEPIKKYLDLLASAQTIRELLNAAVQLENETGLNPLFSFGPSPDLLDSNRYVLYGSGLSTTLPASYMLLKNPQIKALYEGFIAELLKFSGYTDEEAMAAAQSIYTFEEVLSEYTLSNEEASKIENLYNPVSRGDLVKLFSSVDLKDYLSDLGYESVENIIITDVKLMEKTGELLSDNNLEVLKDFCRFRLMIGTGPYLSQAIEGIITGFNSTFLGVTGSVSDEENAFTLLNSVMSSYFGKMYVEKYFSEEAKKDVESIVSQIIQTYEKRIEKLDWMSSSTKLAAISKLKAIKVKIGYPDTWSDPLSGISIKTYEKGGSLLNNIFAITSAQVKYSKTLLSKPVDKSQWMMPSHTVNAYYSATSNEIVFPAGILQSPFYDLENTREQNLGGIGSIIAHEITHAFDNNGAQFDENGNMNNWWTQEDYLTFQQKCQSVIDHYEGIEIAPNAISNGTLTVSENVADIGAMACILDIAKGMPNANYKQLFESNANIWRLTCTQQTYQYLATQDVHAPHKLRVNSVLQNFQEFYDTYDIKPGDTMYLPPEERVSIW